ncbi:DUF402 domain-containing protein [Mycoplasma sp. NEAQ87857]|uniref:DUF402 domain-containing protein n=1 Tax=Mycoplasma sp. NEAQ87857 TaxID=2683967 RepID=UPI0013171436|nr:DUF402 domain-containing protein [Mycoplasma sp. NEAQ87857]QGZ97776.1 DUF402 domain-containing protein [Mycoplasma sp. NEAQ87857]
MTNGFENLKTGQMVNVQAYKHNGFLYRQWNQAKVIFHNKRHVVLFLCGTRVTEAQHNSNGWRYTENAIWFLPKDQLFNSIVLLKKDLGNYYYINMASKPIYEDNTIKFIDYDLDVKCYPEKDLQVVDRDEFSLNSKQMNYPSELKTKIYDEIKNIISLYNDYNYFFNAQILQYYFEILLKDKLINAKTFKKYVAQYNSKYNEESEMFNNVINSNKKNKR